ncbi:MAG: VWA domain-containing protein [Candidatus Sericytochromatia bacterium]
MLTLTQNQELNQGQLLAQPAELVLGWQDGRPQLSRIGQIPDTLSQELASAVRGFLDVLATATARASFYNSQSEQIAATRAVHSRLLGLDRALYALLLGLDGSTDFNRQLGIELLLQGPLLQGPGGGQLSPVQEDRLLDWLLAQLPPQRVLKLFVQLRQARLGGARARRLMLRWLLQPEKLELWAVRYRRKLRLVLEHALGKRNSGVLRSILSKEARSAKENRLLRAAIGRRLPEAQRDRVYECLGFILGLEQQLSLPKLMAYHQAKSDLTAGRRLPLETLEGLRSVYHKAVPSARVLEICRETLTDGQKIGLQRRAAAAGVAVGFDPLRYSPLKLYLYAFEQGLGAEVAAALRQKAAEVRLPLALGHLGLLLDASASMWGDASQRLRPMASALALRDLLCAAAQQSTVICAGGQALDGMIFPEGATALAEGLLQLVQAGAELIVILSDGYENSPAGRVAEVMHGLRQIGIQTPVLQISPVLAAESQGVRALAPGLIDCLPVAEPAALGLGLIRLLLAKDPVQALNGLLGLLPQSQFEALTR